MFLSRYNVAEKFENTTVLYNTLSSGILKLNEEYSSYFNDMSENGIFEKEDLIEELIKGGMLYKEPINEVGLIKMNNLKSRYNSLDMSYTIAPTMECNFKCDYCFEEGKRHNTMSDKVVSDTIDFIAKGSEHSNSINISWYGGEPLIAIKQIEAITKGIKKKLKDGVIYNAGIVTNGYLLSREKAIILSELGVKRTQITLDGSKESHDKRRILLNGKGTFNRIMENIKESCDVLDITIRINLDKRNSEEYINVLDELEKSNIKDKVKVYIAPIDSVNDIANSNICFTAEEFAIKLNEFSKELKSRGIEVPKQISPNISICGAVTANSFLIDPLGDLYKCWNDVSHKEKSIGNIENNKNINNEHIKWVTYDPIVNKKCEECKMLPVCMGGCPHNVINGKNVKCDSRKYNLRNKLEMLANI
ncbi:SPASM domain-containing protein [Faecalimicrobium sp. JNUCC 81]